MSKILRTLQTCPNLAVSPVSPVSPVSSAEKMKFGPMLSGSEFHFSETI